MKMHKRTRGKTYAKPLGFPTPLQLLRVFTTYLFEADMMFNAFQTSYLYCQMGTQAARHSFALHQLD